MTKHTLKTGWVALAISAALGCQAPGQPEPPVSLRTLIAAQVGSAGGQVVSDPPGISCPSTCSAEFRPGTQVKLTAVPDAGWVFDRWSQVCNGSDPTCLIVMKDTMNLGFTFKPAGPVCDAPQVPCGGRCADLTSDANNCGGCGTACAVGESCVAAACMPEPPSCAAPTQPCGAQCVDLSSDQANCGACGNACTADQSCSGAACVDNISLKISAAWDRAGDGDLVIATPNGNTIWWNNVGPDASTDFGQLSHDDRSDLGPEVIFWTRERPPVSGTYHVCFEARLFSPPASDQAPVNIQATVQLPGAAPYQLTHTFTQPTAASGTCSPGLDTFVASVSYP